MFQYLTDKCKTCLRQKYIKPHTFIGIDYLLNNTSTSLILRTFSLCFLFCINFVVLPNNFMVLYLYNFRLYPSFILNTKLLLILLMEIWIGRLVGNASCFFMIYSIKPWVLEHWIRTVRQFRLIILCWSY